MVWKIIGWETTYNYKMDSTVEAEDSGTQGMDGSGRTWEGIQQF